MSMNGALESSISFLMRRVGLAGAEIANAGVKGGTGLGE